MTRLPLKFPVTLFYPINPKERARIAGIGNKVYWNKVRVVGAWKYNGARDRDKR